MIEAPPVSGPTPVGAGDRHLDSRTPRQTAGIAVWNVDGASHTSGLATAPTEWETRVIGFLDQAIGN